MKLHGVIDLHISGEEIQRNPNLWDKLKQALGARADLSTGRMRAAIEATTLVDGSRAALRRLGVTNAVSLVIDDHVLFEDREGNEDDLGDMFLSFHESASVFGHGFKQLRLAAEHREGGLHLVMEAIALTEHPADSAAARIVISGRITDYEPRPGENEEAFRRRIEPLVKDPSLIEIHRRQFESFVSRVAEAVRGTLPQVRVDIRQAEARIQKPASPRALARRGRDGDGVLPPTHRDYDPMQRYYPHPFDGMLSMIMWSSIFSMAMRPDVVVVDSAGHALGHAADVPADVAADPTSFEDVGGDVGGELGGDVGDMSTGDMDFGGGFDGGLDW